MILVFTWLLHVVYPLGIGVVFLDGQLRRISLFGLCRDLPAGNTWELLVSSRIERDTSSY